MRRQSNLPSTDFIPSMWGGRAEKPLFIYIAIGFTLALMPADVLTKFPLLQSFANSMAALVPSIDPISRISSFPEVTKLFFAVMWFLMPWAAAGYYSTKFWPQFRGWQLAKIPVGGWTAKSILVNVIGLPIMWLLVYKTWTETGFKPVDITYTGGRGRAFLTLMSEYRLMLGLIGSFMTMASSFTVVVTLAYLTNFLVRIRQLILPLHH